MPRYKEIIKTLEQSIDDLKGKGITVDALNNAKDDLVAHTENIEKVEENIDAVRKEVLSPIITELRQAGKFSVIGFWIGLISMIVSILSVAINYFPSNVKKQADLSTAPISASTSTSDDIVEGSRVLPQMLYGTHKYTLFTCVDLTSKALEIDQKRVAIDNVTIDNVTSRKTWNGDYLQVTAKDNSGAYSRIFIKENTPLGDIFKKQSTKDKGTFFGLIHNNLEAGALEVDGWKPIAAVVTSRLN